MARRSGQMRVSPGQLLRKNVKRFRGGLVFKAHRLVSYATWEGWQGVMNLISKHSISINLVQRKSLLLFLSVITVSISDIKENV